MLRNINYYTVLLTDRGHLYFQGYVVVINVQTDKSVA